MSLWINEEVVDKQYILHKTAEEKDISSEHTVEKDWWVTAVLKALFNTSFGSYLMFKGGTSLSKGWNLINRFSEDIDLSLDQKYFLDQDKGKKEKEKIFDFAVCANNNQIKKLRKAGRKLIHEALSAELDMQLKKLGIKGYEVINITKKTEDGKAVLIDSDSDPTEIHVAYDSVLEEENNYVKPRVKLEISVLSMEEPNQLCKISSFVKGVFPDYDDEIISYIKTVVPTRTFLEKAMLLNEEFMKETPRTLRMTRHLYDLEKMMDTQFGKDALNDTELYKKVVEHRRKFYHAGYADYDKDYRNSINFCPPKFILENWRKDYQSMKEYFIYGESLSFEELLTRINELNDRFRQIEVNS
jgi:hypothetical protein